MAGRVQRRNHLAGRAAYWPSCCRVSELVAAAAVTDSIILDRDADITDGSLQFAVLSGQPWEYYYAAARSKGWQAC